MLIAIHPKNHEGRRPCGHAPIPKNIKGRMRYIDSSGHIHQHFSKHDGQIIGEWNSPSTPGLFEYFASEH